ncbi:MAG: YfhO family protein [Candidatus Omnitrophota bacterium]|nr:YfhO family protein [Candidatus Omnitrophota bacterium]MDZ4242779.1 YfhO family protein [Candidatus Omnitrophota bacterium]
MPARYKYLLSAVITVILGLNIAHRCDAPPYGFPFNELSDNYWGVIIDIARRWRSLDFGFWNAGIAGGISLFTTGMYPIFNPTNPAAVFLSDDHFYLFKIIEPYAMGVFFMTALLWDEFKAKWYIALFGGLAYMGLLLSKTFSLAASPYLLYACGLFPAMALVAVKLLRRHVYLAATGVGALLALQFLGQSSIQTPQMLIWWAIFFFIYSVTVRPGPKKAAAVKNGVVSVMLLSVFSVGLCAVQMLPSLYFLRFGSSRMAGYYPINNFDLFSNKEFAPGLWQIFCNGVLDAGPIRSKAFVVLGLVSLALAIKHFGNVFKKLPNSAFFYRMWIALAVYFCIPDAAATLAMVFPPLEKFFSPLTYFTFKYALHVLDFAIVLAVCLILSNEELSFLKNGKSPLRDFLAWAVLSLALAAAALPVIFALSKSVLDSLGAAPVFHYFVPENLKNAQRILVKALILVPIFALRPRHMIAHLALAVILLGGGFMMTLDCFKWYDKGQRNHPEMYQIGSPEQVFYTQARGKYLLPFQAEPDWIMHNFNLLYGVRGTTGFLGATPLRQMKFKFYYEAQDKENWESIPYAGNHQTKFGAFRGSTPASLSTYFPADFTLVKKGEAFSWPGFAKTVPGDVYDIYERRGLQSPIYALGKLQVVDFFTLIRNFEKPRAGTVYVSAEDARSSGVTAEDFGRTGRADIKDFQRPRENRVLFRADSKRPFYAVFPETFDAGWRLKIDGERAGIFPAFYLFNGFKVPSGEHRIELTFVPKWFEAGVVVNIFSVILAGVLFIRIWPRGIPGTHDSIQ